jgi:ABC-2 type transport system permease protein
MFGGGAPQPKGDIQALWNALGLNIPVETGFEGINPDIVWQRFNPHAELVNLSQATDQWLFVREDQAEGIDYLSEDSPATAGLRELMFLYSGAVNPDKDRQDLVFTPLAKTRPESGTVGFEKVMGQMRGQDAGQSQLQVLQGAPQGEQVVAAYIEGKAAVEGSKATETKEGDEKEKKSDASDEGLKIRAFYIADIDCLAPYFYESRRRPEDLQINLRVQNITFFLNVIDVLVGETNYPKIRSHEPQHVSLRLFEQQAQLFQSAEVANQKQFQEEFNAEIKKAEEENQRALAKFQEKIDKLRAEGPTDPGKRNELIRELQKLQISTASLERKLAIQREKLGAIRDEKIEDSRREAELKTLREQAKYKYYSILIPPIPPLLVGIAVFVSRRVREREGISKNRLR